MITNPVRVIPIECKFGPIAAFAYYVDAPEPAIIDTGVSISASQDIEPTLAQHGIRIEDIRWILLTHGHVDHLGGAYAVWEKTGRNAKVVIPKKEARLLRDKNEQIVDYKSLQGKYITDSAIQEKHISMLTTDIGGIIEPDLEVVDGDSIHLGGDITLSVIETPGHSIGSVTFVLEGFDWAFAADAVQMYGGLSGMPTIENSRLYRKSIKRLLEEVRPKRLFLGHPFRNKDGHLQNAQVECKKVAEVLKASLDMDTKLKDLVKRHLINGRHAEQHELYGPFGSIADEIGYTGDPRHLPCAFFVTMNGYQEELIGTEIKREEENRNDSEKV
ncbi:MBL fold metallo-hydrolase [Neobacillus niacini]|uniref:MBL fold metallo-hydrolase n=1 Tax=Neobacillus niacini TaxID=86668 RepID=UPI0007AB5FF8|nr:MBL fold metallo-hydrolase [Neobacillus niacini]MEC1522548.1 MBL fold metallo-hydrolase [Neobacillus niacini]